MDTVWTIVRIGTRFVMHMGPDGWMVAMLLVATIGVLSLQGYGSRSNY